MKKLLFVCICLISFKLAGQWVPLSGSLGGDIMSLHVYNSNLYAGGGAYLFRSTDAGITWTSHLPHFSYPWTITSNSNYIFVGIWVGGMSLNSGVYRSLDNGITFQQAGLNNKNISAISNQGESIIAITFVDGDIYKSTDNGNNWYSIKGNLNLGIYVLAVSGDNIYAGAQGLHKTTNDGTSWTPIFMSDNIGAVAASGSTVYAGTYATGLFRSGNYGATWQKVINTTKRINSIYIYGDNVFAGADSSFYISNDGGLSFTERNSGIENSSISSAVVKDDYLYISNSNYLATNVSAYKRPLSQIVSANDPLNPDKMDISLQQNYPNPFNPSTTIEYYLPDRMFIEIKVFDLLGREVALLVNGEYDKGNHKVKFDPSDNPAGIYFCRLISGTYSATKKMLYIK
jgi:hypothetical protein